MTCILEGRPQWDSSFRVLCFHHRFPHISSAYSLHPLSALEMNSTFFVIWLIPNTVIWIFLYLLNIFQYYRTYTYPIPVLHFPILSYLHMSCTCFTFSSNTIDYSLPFLQLPSYLIQFCTYYCHLIFVILYHEITPIFWTSFSIL